MLSLLCNSKSEKQEEHLFLIDIDSKFDLQGIFLHFPEMTIRENIAVIDTGSNSIKLLVARFGEDPSTLETVFTRTVETRISQGIGHSLARLSKKAMTEGLQAINKLIHLAHRYQPRTIRIVATSAVRDAVNGPEFAQKVKKSTGLEMDILSGKEEATLIGNGLAYDPEFSGMKRFVQIDIGGGSLELIRFDQGKIVKALSLPLGAVRLAEQFVGNRETSMNAITESQIQVHVETKIQESHFDFSLSEDPMVATGGALTITRAILAAQAGMTMASFSPKLSITQITTLKMDLMQQTLKQRRLIPNLPATRADVLPIALITIEKIMQLAAQEQLIHSVYNLRYGVAADTLKSLAPDH